MIITLKGADFSASNIGTLSTWSISRVLGTGATYSGVTYVDKDAALSATVTIADGYEIGSAGVTVTMGGVEQSGAAVVDGNTITIIIASVTGNVVIKVPTVNSSTGEEDSGSTTSYTITYKYMSGSTSIKTQTTETVTAGTTKTFSTSNAPSISGYTISSVSPSGSQTINSNLTVTYSYTANSSSGEGSTTTFGTNPVTIVNDISDMEYKNGYSIGGGLQSYATATGRAASSTCLAVNGGETISLTQNIDGITVNYAMQEYTGAPLSSSTLTSSGQTFNAWLSTATTLQSDTKYIMIGFKQMSNVNFTDEQVALLNDCLTIS